MNDEQVERVLAIIRNVNAFDAVERWERIEVAARAALAAWDYDKADAPFEQLRQALAATVGGTDEPSAGGGGPTAGE